MASRYPSVRFISVDSTASPANEELVIEMGVRAFPTFHVYVDGKKVEEWSGADGRRLQASVEKHVASVGGVAGALGSPGSTLQARVHAGLLSLRNECANQEEFMSASRTLLVYIRNLLTHPTEEKYRTVKSKAGTAFHSRLGRLAAGKTLMQAVGFVEEEREGESVMVIKSGTLDPALGTVYAQLEAAVNMGGGVQGAHGASGSRTPSMESALTAALVQSARMSRSDPALRQELARVSASMLAQALRSGGSSSSSGTAVQPPPTTTNSPANVTAEQAAELLRNILSGAPSEQQPPPPSE